MSEVISRPSAPRGRGSHRGGRGGYSSRGGRGGPRSSKPDSLENTAPTSYEDEGEIGQLKLKYATELPTLKELFSDWTDEDLVFALEDANGVLETAIEHISEGNASQWGEVKKKTADRSRSKAKDVSKSQTAAGENVPVASRGGRGRGGLEGRGGRARGDRGRGGRGGRVASTREEKPAAPTDQPVTEPPTTVEPETAKAVEPVDVTKTQQSEVPKAPEPAKKGWASLFAKPAPPPTQPKPSQPTIPQVTPSLDAPTVDSEPATTLPVVPATVNPEVPKELAPEQPPIPLNEPTHEIPPTQAYEAPADDLTKTNLDQVPDVSVPPATATAASTIASVQDPNSLPPVTPQSIRPTSGYAASAFKAAGSQGRSTSFQRRVLEQQEAVVMPANHAVDRAAVQFGSMGLNGSDSIDVDQEREDAETRAQPPQHSPVAPRASLPPPQSQAATETPLTARPAPGLPPVPQADQAPFNDFGRYGEAQKPYDPFTQHPAQSQAQTQEPFSHQAPSQAIATTGGDYSPFYAADQRLPYNYYGYPSQDSTGQRTASGFATSGAEGQGQTAATQTPSRYGQNEAPGSGHNTPIPTLPGASQSQQPSGQHIPGGQAAHANYGYGYPYYSNPHYAQSYMNMNQHQHQYGRNRPMYDDARRYEDHYMPHSNQYAYSNQYAPYGGKGGMYGQPFSYDHASSPANSAGFSQTLPGRDSVYGRTGSAQPENQQSTTAANTTTFGSGVPDVFSRAQSGFGQNQPMSQQQPVSSEDPSKGYETSKTGGPSPSLAQANRPGSATNSIPGQSQSQTGLPPLQGQQGQQGFSGYPHLNPQYSGGLGGLSSHQGGNASQNHHQGSAYANYGGAAGFGNYYGNSSRGGGWGGNYGH